MNEKRRLKETGQWIVRLIQNKRAWLFLLFCAVGVAANAAGAYGGESKVRSFFDGTAGFLIKTVGTGVFLIGLITAGIKIASGDENGVKKAVMVMIGGAIIFLAKPLVAVLTKISGL